MVAENARRGFTLVELVVVMNTVKRRSVSRWKTWRRLIPAACMAALVWWPCSAVGAKIIEEENLTYGKGGDRDLKLDLARPEGDGPFPTLVFIHGGGWRGGSRAGYRAEIVEAAKRGYVAVTVSYRLTEPDDQGTAKHPFPAQVHDVKCAVRWLRANAAKYHVDPDRIGATGGSAGGHLSLMLGLSDATAKLEGSGGHAEQSSRVQAVVNYFGPTDMSALYGTSGGARPIVASFLGGTPEELRDRYLAASPTTHVSKDDPPVLSLHGADDRLVPPDQARALDKKMREAGAPHTLTILDGQGHGFGGQASAKARTALYEFFDKHLKPKGGTDHVLFEEKFSGELADGWSWTREDRDAWRLRDGALEIRTQPGNIWGGANDARNLLVRPLPEEHARAIILEVTVATQPTERYEQAGITWYYDEGNMVKLVRELVDGKLMVVMGREQGDRTRTIALIPLEGGSVELRLRLSGQQIVGQFRGHGKGGWKDAGTCDLPPGNQPKVSLQTYNGPAEAEHWARFTGFRILRPAP